ncbi:MAG: tRNA pseudouridine(38-40) synthase TruA [Hydrogenothermus sp.]|nr:MAG: tRNA pseudouridine(38-40) synthase TruA [Hydrogenothermus sp.]
MQYKHNYKLTIKYIGTRYYGWQRQPKHITIQQTIEDTLQIFIKEKPKLIASGRTDAGVHALGQVANFKTTKYFEPEKIKKYLNATLPRDIAIVNCKEVPLSFNARFSAKGKTYIYKVYTKPDPFLVGFGWYISKKINITKIQEAIEFLRPIKKLKSMAKDGDYLREEIDIRHLSLKYDGNVLEFEISASHFLRYMVRKIVAHLVHIGTGRLDIEKFKEIIKANDPSKGMFIAPPEGLYLKEVYYLPEDEDLNLQK